MALEFKRILCPVDLSEFSLEALRLAVKIAESSRAILDILHVIHNPFDEIYLTSVTQTDPALLVSCQNRGRFMHDQATSDLACRLHSKPSEVLERPSATPSLRSAPSERANPP